jgi:hypothetical protein
MNILQDANRFHSRKSYDKKMPQYRIAGSASADNSELSDLQSGAAAITAALNVEKLAEFDLSNSNIMGSKSPAG